MIEEWVNVEDNPLVIDIEINNQIGCLEKGEHEELDNEDDDLVLEVNDIKMNSYVQKKKKLTLSGVKNDLIRVRKYITTSKEPIKFNDTLLWVANEL